LQCKSKEATFQGKSWLNWIEEHQVKSWIWSRSDLTALSTFHSDSRTGEVIDCHFALKTWMTKMSTPLIDPGVQDGWPFLREKSMQMNSGSCFCHKALDFAYETNEKSNSGWYFWWPSFHLCSFSLASLIQGSLMKTALEQCSRRHW
jgi:hypothetical protein